MKVKVPFIKFGILLVLFFIVGCGEPVKQVEALESITIAPFAKAKPVQFKKIVVKLRRGEEIGRMKGGYLCVDWGPLLWRGGRVSFSDDELTEVFIEEFEKAGYPVVGDPDALFEDTSEWKAELLVAGMVKELQADLCYPNAGFYDWNSCKGKAYMKVDWQIYARLKRKVVYETTTEGSSNVKQANTTGESDIFLNAFATATQNLLADQGFHELVVGKLPVLEQEQFEEVSLPTVKTYQDKIQNQITKVRSAVVTVFANEGHGSGFFISEDGHLLTNEHVVRDAKLVTVKLITGRELTAEVLRKNETRDVALLRVEQAGMVPLPLRKNALNVSDEVYSIGSPLKEELDVTLSKGIVSSFRTEDGLKFIQSDANILPGNSGGPLVDANGNVAGIAVHGYVWQGTTGLNFFIPIDEALSALEIRITE